jgi:hypothetical protein
MPLDRKYVTELTNQSTKAPFLSARTRPYRTFSHDCCWPSWRPESLREPQDRRFLYDYYRNPF